VRNFKLTVSYDGTAFGGWQVQPNARTVQAVLEEAIRSITQDERVFCNASGRTDSGVHAIGQVVNFFSATTLEPEILVKAVNAKLPEDVTVRDCCQIHQSFCANKDAKSKRYCYVINEGRIPDLFQRKYSWQPRRVLNADAMQSAARCLLGRHDFRSFETHWPNRLTSIRTIFDISVCRVANCLRIEVEADGFLYNMVRSIAGTLYQIGRSYWPVEKMKDILDAMDRKEAGPTAPPQGLFLMWVKYD
jgi:tRNA pseudouridine38-40 synthase